MGVLNCTPDSFYAASRLTGVDAAVERGLRLKEEGADILDVGGQSTRPGASSISVEEELGRTIPVVRELARRGLGPISIDTDKAEVARAARQAGATILNDILGLRGPGMLDEAKNFEKVVIMHMGGTSPKDMQANPVYGDVVKEVKAFLAERKKAFVDAGGDSARLIFDPGIGFGKTLEHNLSLIKHLDNLRTIGPILLGVSRKSFIGKITGEDNPDKRLEGSLAVACYAALKGADYIRVHDVLATRRGLKTFLAVEAAE